MAWKPEVKVMHEESWSASGLRFATEAEAKESVKDLASRWILVRDTRVVECNDPINAKWVDDKLEMIR